jgi:tRNA uridine 5-carboxymethylaminomethyl modification enzyme
MRRPDVTYAKLMSLSDGKYASAAVSRETLGDLVDPVIEQIDIAAKYSGYIDRQKEEVGRAAHYENLKLPSDLDYLQISALGIEVRQKLSAQQPETLGQASLLLVHLKKSRAKGFVGVGVKSKAADEASTESATDAAG